MTFSKKLTFLYASRKIDTKLWKFYHFHGIFYCWYFIPYYWNVLTTTNISARLHSCHWVRKFWLWGQNSDQNHGKCSFGHKKVRILDSSQKFWKVGQNNNNKKKTNFRCFLPKFSQKFYAPSAHRIFLFFCSLRVSRRFLGVGFLVPPPAPPPSLAKKCPPPH